MKIVWTRKDSTAQWYSDFLVLIKPSWSYDYSAWVRTENCGPGVDIGYEFFDSSKKAYPTDWDDLKTFCKAAREAGVLVWVTKNFVKKTIRLPQTEVL